MGLFSWLKNKSGGSGESADARVPGSPQIMRLSYRGANLQGIGSRSAQEDYFTFANLFDVRMILERGLLAVVADGMGGMSDGRFAAETAVNTVRAAFRDLDLEGDIPGQLSETAQTASMNVFRELDGCGGCTLAVCVIYEERLYMLSVGDSFVYLRREGQLYRLNREQNIQHSLYLEALRRGSTDRAAAENDPERAALSQFIGMGELDDIDIFVKPLPLRDGDVLMICSDGVGGVLDEEEILAALGMSAPEVMCAALEQGIISKARPAQDNYTALVIKCSY